MECQSDNQTKLRIDILSFIFFTILAIALSDCFFQLFSYIIFGTVKSRIACFLLGLLLAMVFVFVMRKTISIYLPHFNVADLIFFAVFGFLFATKIVFPDWGGDTATGEVFIQEFQFTDKLEAMKPYNLPLPSAWYGLYSTVFYYIRTALGYRLTMLVNVFIIVVLYYKLKELLIWFWQDSNSKKVPLKRSLVVFGISVSALLVLFDDNLIIGMVWNQKSDLFILPLFFECLRLAFCHKKLDSKQYIYAALLAGIGMSIKLTNIVFFIPLIIYVLIRDIHAKHVKPRTMIFASIAFVLPLLPFAIYGILLTGSPVFPFYNKIFKSSYFGDYNFRDSRFGPQGIIETLLWPFISIFDIKRFSYIYSAFGVPVSSGRTFIGYIVTFGSIILYAKTGQLKNRLPLMLCLVVGIILGSAVTGVERYTYTSELFSIFIVIVVIFDLLKYNRQILVGLCMSVVAISITVSLMVTIKYAPDWHSRPSIFTYRGGDFIRNEYLPNLALLGRDRNITDDPELQHQLNNVKTWVFLEGCFTAHGIIANPNADIMWYDWTINSQLESGETTKHEITMRFFENRDTSGIYSIHTDDPYPSICKQYLEWGFIPINITPIKLKSVIESRTSYLVEWQLDLAD